MSGTTGANRVALVTGCGKAQGIGAAAARALAAQGFDVVVSDIAESGLANDRDAAADAPPGWSGLPTLASELRAAGVRSSAVCGDVSNESEVDALVAEVLHQYGRIDVLVNNAAAPHGDDRVPIESLSRSAWERVMTVNAGSVFLMTRRVIGPMRERSWGRVINISSAIVRHPMADRVAYTASKAAIVGFTQALACEVAADGITVNAICPGSIVTARAISSTRLAGWQDLEAGLAARARGIPAGRHGRAEEVAATIAFLCSEAAGYLTGQAIFVDGGGLPRPV